jgi:hypothetical protein
MDEVRLYNRALTPQEISLQYSSNLAKTDTGNRLLSFWPDFSTQLSQTMFGYSEDLAGNKTWTEAKRLRRDTTPPEIMISTPTQGARISTNFTTLFDIDEINFANTFIYTISGQSYTIFDSGTQVLLNFDYLSNLPADDTFGLMNIAARRDTYTFQNQTLQTPARIKSGYILKNSSVYFVPERGKEGGAYRFDGTSGSFISIENTQDLTEFSINFRVNMDVYAKGIQYIFSKGTGIYLYTNNGDIRLHYDGSDHLLDTASNYFLDKQRNFISLSLSD